MATVAATIADGGRRPQPTFALGAHPHSVASATSASVARTVRRLMIGVVREGTGTSAAIPGVTVAGKTGTAELGTVNSCSGSGEGGAAESSGEAHAADCQGAPSDPSNTDAWFAAFAPALHPRIVVCVLMVKDGAGGDTAAPVAREVLEAGLRASR
jgi:cell division protein FtsI/penicillin-binding protein 2